MRTIPDMYTLEIGRHYGTCCEDVKLYAWEAHCRDSLQAGAHEEDIGSFLCCCGDSLQE